MDGTLSVANIPFGLMRELTAIPRGDLFTVMEDWAHEGEAAGEARVKEAMRVILELEAQAQATLELAPGLEALLEQCEADGLRLALVTRNTPLAVDALFRLLGERWRARFAPLLTRHFRFVKPDRRLLLHVAEEWGCSPAQLLMVGDSREDVEIGAACGSHTCLIEGAGNEVASGTAVDPGQPQPTLSVRALSELAARLRSGPLPPPAPLPRGVGFISWLSDRGHVRLGAVSYARMGGAAGGLQAGPPATPFRLLHADCGDGALTKALHSQGVRAEGVDGCAARAALAAGKGLCARAVDSLAAVAGGAAFDALLAVCEGEEASLLFHRGGAVRAEAAAEAARLLRPDGVLALEWSGEGGSERAAAAAAALLAAPTPAWRLVELDGARMVAARSA